MLPQSALCVAYRLHGLARMLRRLEIAEDTLIGTFAGESLLFSVFFCIVRALLKALKVLLQRFE